MEVGKRDRIDYLDTAKGIGIIMVCVGHACTNQSSVQQCKLVDIIRFVTLFHMALFFFINGMLYHEKYSDKPVLGITKKIKAYYLPFAAYNLLFWALHNIFAKLHLISGKLDSKDYAYVGFKAYLVSLVKSIVGFRQRFAGAMWFLEALIVILLVFILMDYMATRFFARKRILTMTLLVFVIMIVNRLFSLSDIPCIPGSLTQMVYWGFNGLVFFYLGYLYKIYQWNEKLIRYKHWMVPFCFAILIFAVIVMRPKVVSVITNSSIPIYKYGMWAIYGQEGVSGLSLMQYFLYAVVCLTGIVMTVMFAQMKIISKCTILKVLGRYSLHIMCLQFLAFKSVSIVMIMIYRLPIDRLAEYPVIYDVDGLWWIAYTVSACVLPILAVKLYEKTKEKVLFICKRSSAS